MWQAALRGDSAYTLHVRLALDDTGDILGGIAFELYPRSQCGLVTYLVVAPGARERGLGRQLLDGASRSLYAAGARAVLGEVSDPLRSAFGATARAGIAGPCDPRVHGDAAQQRLDRFVRWGARRIDVPYVQPSLGEGLARDHGLCLIVLPPVPAVVENATVHAFIDELYAATEGPRPPA